MNGFNGWEERKRLKAKRQDAQIFYGVLSILASWLVAVCAIVYVTVHFIAKFW